VREKRRVVVTGMGVVSALGLGVDETWSALRAGRTGIGPIASFDASRMSARVAAEVHSFSAADFVDNRKILRLLSRGEAYAMAAAKMAFRAAGLMQKATDPGRGGVYLGCGKEGGPPERIFDGLRVAMDGDRVDIDRFGSEGSKRIYALYLVEGLTNACLYYLTEAYHLQGTNTNIVGSGAAGAQAIGEAFRAIQRGDADYAIAGGFDAPINPANLVNLGALGILETGGRCAQSFRPFARDRSGSILGEGAGIVILEELGHACARNAPIHAELTGYAATTDPVLPPDLYHNWEALAEALRAALCDAGIEPDRTGYIHANGNASRLGDAQETLAIKNIFAEHAYRLPVSSIKPMTGDLMAAAGPLELIATTLAMKNGRIPPTLNYENPDPACDLDYVPGEAREATVDIALTISRGLGGQNVVLVLKAVGEEIRA
jgi:3-oxoacyl-[acyl-carrier-protein] synthase II